MESAGNPTVAGGTVALPPRNVSALVAIPAAWLYPRARSGGLLFGLAYVFRGL
jgi:hypothetical protein